MQVLAKAYDNPIPGFKTPTVGNLRLWEALPVAEFDLSAFNEGKYDKVRPACPSPASPKGVLLCAGIRSHLASKGRCPIWNPLGGLWQSFFLVCSIMMSSQVHVGSRAKVASLQRA